MNNFVREVAAHHGISAHRIQAMVLRYWYLLMSSWPRLLELIYWPALQIITWGFLQSYISQNDGFFARAGGTLIGAVILWDILFRGQLGFSISFLEEMWARNLVNLMMSPLKPIEFLILFFSSRRRHTRLQGDWSSDVCSSDLGVLDALATDLIETTEQRVLASSASSVEDIRRAHNRLFFFQAEDGIRDVAVTGVQTCALPI